MFLFYFLLFIFGSAIGSFLGVVVDRTITKEPVWKGRSHCDHCRHLLHPFDLIPIVSFFMLGGRCKYCHKKLSGFYPLIELCTGLVFAAIGYTIFGTIHSEIIQPRYVFLFLYYLFLSSTFISIFFTDLKYGIIPFKIVIASFIILLIWYMIFPFLSFSQAEIQLFNLQTNPLLAILSAIGAGGFFLLLFILTKGRGMGFGDVVYAFLMGFTLGFPRVLLGLYIAFVTGAIISLILIALKKKKFKGGTIPFGPFLVLGTFISLLWGDETITYILRYFGI